MTREPKAAKGDVKKQVDEAEDQGFFGIKVDPLPNEAYTLTTGPDSPTNSPNDRVEQIPAYRKDG